MSDSKGYITSEAPKGSINISEDVISTIAAAAVMEIEGVAGFATSMGNEIVEFLGKKNSQKGASKGVKITVQEEQITVDTYILIKYGFVIAEVAKEVQDEVFSAIEAMTGVTVSQVNVQICGIAFEKSKQ